MIPLIENADLVTASPYHPQGSVRNVPGWRLVLSKTLSRMYSGVLSERIHTFTSCCRVYRKSAVAHLELSHGGFLGCRRDVDRDPPPRGTNRGIPCDARVALLGESKMKIVARRPSRARGPSRLRAELGAHPGAGRRPRGRSCLHRRRQQHGTSDPGQEQEPLASISLESRQPLVVHEDPRGRDWASFPSYLDPLVDIVLERLDVTGSR